MLFFSKYSINELISSLLHYHQSTNTIDPLKQSLIYKLLPFKHGSEYFSIIRLSAEPSV